MTTSIRTARTILLAALVLGCATVGIAFTAFVVGYAPVALASQSEQASASEPMVTSEQTSASETIVMAQSQASAPSLNPAPRVEQTPYPAYQAGVRHAAAQGNEALRRYIWRTRTIYNFYFNDFAKED